MKDLFWIAISLFIVMDSVGSIPIYISVLKGLPSKRQYRIIFREMVIALIIIIIFNFMGATILEFLKIDQNTVSIAGGIILFLLGLKMVFPPEKEEISLRKVKDPFIVPLAVPLIAGPAVLATVMLFAKQETSQIRMLIAIGLAWAGSLCVLLLAPWTTKKLGDKGIIAIERLMGLVLILMSIQMFMTGVKKFFSIA